MTLSHPNQLEDAGLRPGQKSHEGEGGGGDIYQGSQY